MLFLWTYVDIKVNQNDCMLHLVFGCRYKSKSKWLHVTCNILSTGVDIMLNQNDYMLYAIPCL